MTRSTLKDFILLNVKNTFNYRSIYFKSAMLTWILTTFLCLMPLHGQPISSESAGTLNVIFSKKILPNVDFRDAAASLEIWTKEILSEIYSDYSLNNIFVEGIEQVDEKFINEKASFIIITPLEYLTNQEKLNNVTPTLLSSDDDGLIGIEYVLLVHKSSNISSLKDLKNKTLAFVDDYSNAVPRLWLDVSLKNEGLLLSNKFFSEIFTAQNTNQVVLKTYFRQIDACIVSRKLLNTSFVLNPQLKSDLIIIKQSEPFIASVVCTNQKVSESTRKDFIKSATIAMETDRGKQVALFFRIKNVQEFKPLYLDNMKNLISQANLFHIKINY